MRFLFAAASALVASPAFAQLTTAFTYQGELRDGDGLASGVYDLQFRLFVGLTGGGQAGTTDAVRSWSALRDSTKICVNDPLPLERWMKMPPGPDWPPRSPKMMVSALPSPVTSAWKARPSPSGTPLRRASTVNAVPAVKRPVPSLKLWVQAMGGRLSLPVL